MKRCLSLLFAAALALTVTATAAAQDARTPAQICEGALPAADPETRTYEATEPVLEPGVDYYAIFCTGAGAVYVDLLEDYTPLTVNNFVFLAQNGYYNNTTFHRVIADFMAQGGDPTATGTGGPGYQFTDEFLPYLTFDTPGLLAMANAGAGTNGSQFFITTEVTDFLNYRHTIFGKVLDGQANVEAIRLRDPETDPDPGTSLDTVVIITDPAAVAVDIPTPDTAAASAEDIEAAFEVIRPEIPEGLIIDDADSGILTTEETAASAPEAEQSAFADFLAAHNHAYRVTNSIETTTCDLSELPFMQVSYTVDAFASAADARAAITDGYLGTLAEAEGYTASSPILLRNPMYSRSETVCDMEATHAFTHLQRGHYIATAEIIIPADQAATPDIWLTRFVGGQLYEALLTDIFAAEL